MCICIDWLSSKLCPRPNREFRQKHPLQYLPQSALMSHEVRYYKFKVSLPRVFYHFSKNIGSRLLFTLVYMASSRSGTFLTSGRGELGHIDPAVDLLVIQRDPRLDGLVGVCSHLTDISVSGITVGVTDA